MIQTWNLGKTFRPPTWPLSLGARRLMRPVRALHGVNLEVGQGEIFGLLGPNGAGKTTLLKVLATLLLPSEGRAEVNGTDVVREEAAVRRVVGLATGDERGFYWRLTGRENLEFFAGLQGLSPRAARRRADAVLELVDLLSYAPEVVARYSTGMRQRLSIARALLGNPSVLFLDEPTRSLDPLAAERVQALIQRLAQEQGKTVLLATHHLAEAAAICQRVAILVGGMVRDVIPLSSIKEAALAARYRSIVEVLDGAAQPTVGLP